ncbi:MAG TPA: hypothetical protein VN493_05365 [Thermoanaerobaculia bacterium]|nr:hypothetical protein [Thermoanaerobaculia bacterium]
MDKIEKLRKAGALLPDPLTEADRKRINSLSDHEIDDMVRICDKLRYEDGETGPQLRAGIQQTVA